MSFSVSCNNADLFETSQVIYDVLAFTEIDFLKGIADFDFLVFDHATQVGNMRGGRFKWKFLFNLHNISPLLPGAWGRRYLTSEVAGEIHGS